MRDCTKWAIEALIKGDDSITPKERGEWLQALRGDTPAPVLRPRLVSFREACEITGLSRSTVSALADRGDLQRVFTSAGGKRCRGLTAESIDRWIASTGGKA